MDQKVKDIFMTSVIGDTLKDVQSTFNKYKLVKDDSFFDYELLKVALERKDIKIVDLLLIIGCRVRNPNKVNLEETAFHLAMKLNDSIIVETMLKNGASINDKNLSGETALYVAFKQNCKNSICAALTFLSTINREDINNHIDSNIKYFDPTNRDNIVHFHIACVTNHCDAAKMYLKHKFDVNSYLILDFAEFVGLNPLHYAAIKSKLSDVFQFLLKYADLSVKDGHGKTILHIMYYSIGLSEHEDDKIKQIFESGNDTKFINSVDNIGVSHFHICCTINYPEHVQLFIDKVVVDINSPVSSNSTIYPGYTPLHFAVMHGCDKVVELLLKNGADCSRPDKEGTTPLHLACKLIRNKGQLTIIKILVNYKACLTAVDKNNCTPLHLAFYSMNHCEVSKILDILISKIPREINCIDNHGFSHFHIVCTTNDISRVKDFLKSGVAIDSCAVSGKYSGYTALHFAILYKHKDIVDLLLKCNAQVNVKTSELQLAPLHLACIVYDHIAYQIILRKTSKEIYWILNHKSPLDIIKLLLLHGADVDTRDCLGKTPLFYTCTFDRHCYTLCTYIRFRKFITKIKKTIGILLSYKANVNACTNSKESILHLLSKIPFYLFTFFTSELEKLIEYLISASANIHSVDNAGYTPLHIAAKLKNREIVQIFLKHKADVNAKSNDSMIPLQVVFQNLPAYERDFTTITNDIVSVLLENDSEVNVRNENKTLLHIAIENRNRCLVEKLLYYGADINLEDSFGDLFKWDNVANYNMYRDMLLAQVYHIIFTHVQKLLALGLYVSEEVQRCCETLILRIYDFVKDHVFDMCIKELDKMKLIKIDNYTLLYNILRKDIHDISNYVRNSILIKTVEDPNIDNNFPLYSFLLKLKFKKGLKRSGLLNNARAALNIATKFNLPDLCHDAILKYLSNEDITNLIKAVKKNKRKLDDDYSSDTGSTPKLQKL